MKRGLIALVVAVGLVSMLGCQGMGGRMKPAPTNSVAQTAPNPLEAKVKTQAGTIMQLESRLKARDAQIADLTKAVAHERTLRTGLEQENAELRKRPKALDLNDLAKEVGPDVTVSQRDGGVALSCLGEVLFDSGKATLSRKGTVTLARLAGVLRKKFPGKQIVVEGHTDNVPIRKSKYLSNWELSAQRSLSVLHFLVDKEKFGPKQVAAVAYGETQPVANNKTETGRRQNRRAVIVVKDATL